MAAKKKTETTGKVFIVETPVKDFCGVGAAGIQFAYGKAEVCEGWVLDWFREHGYKVTEKAAAPNAAADKAETN
jgi:hypothetical protein